nr:hypothetical protein CFP56_41770 [Quercus suber]
MPLFLRKEDLDSWMVVSTINSNVNDDFSWVRMIHQSDSVNLIGSLLEFVVQKGYIFATIRSSEPAPTAIGEGSGDIGKKINHGGGDVDGDEDDYFDDGDEGDGGGLFRRQKFLEERMAGHRHLICCSASSLLCNKIFLKICCISLSSTKLE